MSPAIVDLFAGPGGWDEGLRILGRTDVVGLERDETACLTARDAGHRRIQADVWSYPPQPCSGLIASPPCPTFSSAGKRDGVEAIEILASAIIDAFTGRLHARDRTNEVAAAIYAASNPKRRRADRKEYARRQALTSMLVVAPAVWIRRVRPPWVAMEQVPPVASLWDVYAHEMRRIGYAADARVLCAADYGVPQTRRRAFLIAGLDRCEWPAPTHCEGGADTLLGRLEPWVSMAEALGWSEFEWGWQRPDGETRGHSTSDPAPTVCGARNPAWARADWVVPTVDSKVGSSWTLHTGRDQCEDGTRQTVTDDRPAPSLTSKSGGQWMFRRPSTTVCATPRIGRPGHKDYEGGESQFGENAVKVTIEQAAVLQSFRPDYPFSGTKTAKFRQVGDAVPPLLAAHILRAFVEAS